MTVYMTNQGRRNRGDRGRNECEAGHVDKEAIAVPDLCAVITTLKLPPASATVSYLRLPLLPSACFKPSV